MTKSIEALPPLPEWSKQDNLGGLVPSQIRSELSAYATAAVLAERERCLNALRIALAHNDVPNSYRPAILDAFQAALKDQTT